MSLVQGLSRVAKVTGLAFLVIVVIAVGALLALDWQARESDQVRLIEVPFTVPGSSALTTGRIIFIDRDRADDTDLLAHELVHVCQWEERGIEFLWEYSTEYLDNLVELRDLDAAYVEISFEEEARLGEIDCDLDHYLAPGQ